MNNLMVELKERLLNETRVRGVRCFYRVQLHVKACACWKEANVEGRCARGRKHCICMNITKRWTGRSLHECTRKHRTVCVVDSLQPTCNEEMQSILMMTYRPYDLAIIADIIALLVMSDFKSLHRYKLLVSWGPIMCFQTWQLAYKNTGPLVSHLARTTGTPSFVWNECCLFL